MTKKNLTWQDIFKGPFQCDDYGIYMFASTDDYSVTALDCHTDDTGRILKSLCNFLNNETNIFQPKITKIVSDNNDCCFEIETGDVISVRSWGYLRGCKHLSDEKAAQFQDEFLKYVVDKINKAQEITGLYN